MRTKNTINTVAVYQYESYHNYRYRVIAKHIGNINNQYRMSEVAIICGGIAMQISYRVTGDRNEYNL